ncbi:TPA: hypothetical protein ACN37W_004107 [Vibrio parahaemolyticus]
MSLFLSCQLNAAQIGHTFELSTYILKNRLYDYSIELDADPNFVELVFDENDERFETTSVSLLAKTDIPSSEDGVGFEYTLSLLDNTSQCVSTISNETVNTDIVSLSIDTEALDFDSPVEGLPFNSTDELNNLLGTSTLFIHGNELANVDQVQKCQGNILIEVELTL